MKLYISVLGGNLEEITKLIDFAIGEYVVWQGTNYDFDTKDGLITITTHYEDVEKLVDYIWKWLTPRFKQTHEIRFYKGAAPNYNLRLVDHMLW